MQGYNPPKAQVSYLAGDATISNQPLAVLLLQISKLTTTGSEKTRTCSSLATKKSPFNFLAEPQRTPSVIAQAHRVITAGESLGTPGTIPMMILPWSWTSSLLCPR